MRLVDETWLDLIVVNESVASITAATQCGAQSTRPSPHADAHEI
jgi:hypothetical protein